MITRWLETPEARRWWGDPEQELALLTEDLDEPAMRQWIVACDGRAFAYVQAYSPDRWPQPHLMNLPIGAAVVDTFIGEPEMIGAGHGSRYLRAFALKLLNEGASEVAIDPLAENLRARRAYARAGFVDEEVVDVDGDSVVVMLFRTP